MVAACSLVACDKESGSAGDSKTSGNEPGSLEAKAQDIVDKAVAEGEKRAGAKLFDNEVAKNACEILTPALVSTTFGVPEPDLKQMKIMGCTYSAKAVGPEKLLVNASFTTIMMHKSDSVAQAWFANATKGMTREEADRQMDQVTRRAQDHETIDTKTKKRVVGDMGELIKQATSTEGIQYESVEGVGDEARVTTSDGALWVRRGSLTFVVGAYKGTPQPPTDLKGVAVKDMTKKAMQAHKDWMESTVPQRKEAAIKLGKAVVAALP